MTDLESEYGRLLAERDRLIASGVDPADLEVIERPPARAAAPSVEPCEQCEMWRKQYNSDIANGLVGPAKRYLRMIDAHVRAHVPPTSPEPTPGLREAAERVLSVFDGRQHPDESPDEEPISGWDNWHASMENLRAALAAPPAPEPTGLDAAWAEAEAALPKRNWKLRLIWHPQADDPTKRYEARAEKVVTEWIGDEKPKDEWSDTPAAALRALAARLTGEAKRG